jgi:hypothetical protein
MGGKGLNLNLYSAGEFLKIRRFKVTIRKFLNMVAIHSYGRLKASHICLFETLFSCQCPFEVLECKTGFEMML